MKSLKEKTKNRLAVVEEAVIDRILEKIFDYAVAESADEIVLESLPDRGLLKFYDAGEEKGCLNFSLDVESLLFSSLRSLAGLPPSGSAQGGQFKKEFAGGKMVFSVSAYDSAKQKRLIISLSRENFQVFSVGQLGFEKNVVGRIKEVLEKAQGLVLAVGPFNSGKTSSLYSFVSQVDSPDLNVATFEQEISADLPSVNQSRLGGHKGSGRLPAFSSILRQDPDVVMIDELVDKEGAESALHLADRGYFVLAGVYGKNFSSTLDFFQSLGISLPLFVSSVKMMINQRLVSRNCPFCLKKAVLGEEMKRRLKAVFSRKALFEDLRDRNIISDNIASVEEIVFYESTGCPKCRHKGLYGKVGLFEVLLMNEAVAKLIKEGHFLKIDSEVPRQGADSLATVALIKAAAGLISPKELLKIAEEKIV